MPSVQPDRPLRADETQKLLDVSRETLDRLTAYLELIRRWQKAINLVGGKTLGDPWRRHILDCGQLVRWLPAGRLEIADLGSGAGLPGIVLALMTEHRIHLIESDQRKAVFLREVARELAIANVMVHACRIEALDLNPVDLVTARALAPLDDLLDRASDLWQPRTIGLFLKGAKLNEELTVARRSWTISTRIHKSLADPTGQVLEVKEVRRAG